MAALSFVYGCAEAGDVDGGGTGDAGPVEDSGGNMNDSGDRPPDDGGGNTDDAGRIVPGLECGVCASDSDCATGQLCVELPSGGSVCLRTCDPDLPDCPARFDCVTSLISPLPSPVCAPIGERCCVDGDGDDHGMGVGCDGSDCDDGNANVNPAAPEQCDGADNNCDGTSDEGDPGSGFVCSTGLTGACSSGSTVCQDGALVCMPEGAMMAETCNGIDDDCDSNVDEDDMGRALTRPCYDGAAGTAGVGICTEGVQTCAGGEYRSCVGQIQPTTETCDNRDEDCDGTVDDGNPGGGFSCSTPGAGICGPGTTQCMGGTVSCVGTIAPGSQPEICDDVDNDCDGTVNDGYPGLGMACTSGQGICRRGGVMVCNSANRMGAPICDAMPGTPNPSETCDYVDDNCNGTVDEGFRNASGVYDTVANCGGCGNDCNLGWPGGAASVHVMPTCVPSGSSAMCSFNCTGGYIDADRIRDNGCEFLAEPDTIYVSTPANGGLDGPSCGTAMSPCATIGRALACAAGTMTCGVAAPRRRIRVSQGLYIENITLVNGVSVLGGHAPSNWVQNPAVFGTTIRGTNTAPAMSVGGANDRVVVTALSITMATELSGFTINGVNAGAGGNSIAVYVRDSNNNFLITNNDIAPNAGGNGSDGMAGVTGGPGGNGADGIGRVEATCSNANNRPGPLGGANTCGGTSTAGGAGGASNNPLTSSGAPTRQPTAGTGAVAGRGGPGGAGGFNMEGVRMGLANQCNIYGTPTEGGVGTTGTPGPDGAGGAGSTDTDGTVAAGIWRSVAGANGAPAGHGGGGGGGAAPGGVEDLVGGTCLFPPTGGGGGAGGCGGTFGSGGTGGGASFGVFVVYTSTVAASAMVRITGNRLRRGNGGRGGDGGTGGGGGPGGLGGRGGAAPGGPPYMETFDFCIASGAVGGAGGRGGHAGGGGGGAGGVSFDVFVSRPGAAMPDFSGNTYEIPAGTNTGGAGGNGGNSSQVPTGLGTAGVAGAFGQIRIGT